MNIDSLDIDSLKEDFYEMVIDKDANTPSAILSILDEFGDELISAIPEYILSVCAKKGIPTDTVLSHVQEYTKEERERKARIEQERITADLAEKVKGYQDNISRGVSTDDPDLKALAGDIAKKAATLADTGTQSAELKRPKILLANAYLAECETYNPSQDFKPSMLAGLRFPNGTLSYIGGRPGAGKSAILVNIAREALAAGRNVFLVNLEMLNKAIATNIILSYMYENTSLVERRELNAEPEPAKTYYSLFKEGFTAEETFVTLRREAIEKITPLFGNRLVIYDGTRGTLEEVIADISSRVHEGDVVLIDYVQRLPPPSWAKRDARYLHIKFISNELLKTAINKKAVIISGAQFGRDVSKEATLDSFREGGDIEQDAHNALAIETPAEGIRYVHVLKAREGGAKFKRQKLNCVFPYLYIDGIDEEFLLADADDQPKSKKGKSKKPAYDPNDPDEGWK